MTLQLEGAQDPSYQPGEKHVVDTPLIKLLLVKVSMYDGVSSGAKVLSSDAGPA